MHPSKEVNILMVAVWLIAMICLLESLLIKALFYWGHPMLILRRLVMVIGLKLRLDLVSEDLLEHLKDV